MDRAGLVVMLTGPLGIAFGACPDKEIADPDCNVILYPADGPQKGIALHRVANLEKQRATLKPEEFQQKEQLAYAEFMKLKQEFEAQIETQTKKVLEEVAKEKKLGAVIYKNGMAWGGIDVTDDVLKKLQ